MKCTGGVWIWCVALSVFDMRLGMSVNLSVCNFVYHNVSVSLCYVCVCVCVCVCVFERQRERERENERERERNDEISGDCQHHIISCFLVSYGGAGCSQPHYWIT